MGLQPTKQRNDGLESNSNGISDNLVHRERPMRSAQPWNFVRFRHRLRTKRPWSEADADMKEKDRRHESTPQTMFLKCDSRQAKSTHRHLQGLDIKTCSTSATTCQDLRITSTRTLAHNMPSNRPTSLNDGLRTWETLNATESTDNKLEIAQTVISNKLWSDCLPANDSSCCTAQTVLDQTTEFLAYEIDPFIVEEFLRSRRQLHRRGVEINNSDFLASNNSNSVEGMRSFLSVLMRDPLSEDYLLFCDLLRDEQQGNERYIADFLETLSAITRLQDAPTSKEDLPEISSHLFDTTTASDHQPKQFSKCTCVYQGDFSRKDDRFNVSLVYADRESRTAKSFKGVASMKRRKNRKLRPDPDHTKVHLGDTSDRYVPMMSLHLYKQCLCDERMRSLQRLVGTYECIRDLSIIKTRLEDQAKIRLGRALEQNTGLYQLDLSLNALGNDGTLYVADALRTNRSLRVLNLSSNELTARGCDLLVKGLLRNRTLNDLDLGFNEIGDGGCTSLAEALQTNKCSLQKLRLRNNGITCRGATALFTALRKNSRLCLLDLSSNEIGDGCLHILSEVLIYNRTLADLVIDSCRISKSGCSNLARPLKINTVLKRLSLNRNPIGDSGLRTLVEGIKYNRSVTEISLNMCGITNCGLWHLLNAMRHNTTVKTIKLCYNLVDIGSEQPKYGVRALLDRVERRSSAFIGQNVTSGSSPKDERRSSFFVERRHNLSFGESESVALTGDGVISGEGFSRSELYSKLVQVLHSNSPLKVVLWGNRLNDIKPTISERMLTNAFN